MQEGEEARKTNAALQEKVDGESERTQAALNAALRPIAAFADEPLAAVTRGMLDNVDGEILASVQRVQQDLVKPWISPARPCALSTLSTSPALASSSFSSPLIAQILPPFWPLFGGYRCFGRPPRIARRSRAPKKE